MVNRLPKNTKEDSTSPIIYTCDVCHREIKETEERIRCLECENIDLCHDCYSAQKDIHSHLHTHRMLVIPKVSACVHITYDDEPCGYGEDIPTDCEDRSVSDVMNQLNAMEIDSFSIDEDHREESYEINASLALEILDAMCYFQFDFEGIASVLSKRVSTSLIADYIYNVVLYDPKSDTGMEETAIEIIPSSNPPECQFSWDYEIEKKEEVFRETFSPTVLEYMVRDMSLSSCHAELVFSLKEMEPLLHQTFHSLISPTQIPSLLSFTMNKRYMNDLKRHILQMQQRLFPKEKLLDEKNESMKRKLLQQYANQTLYFLPPLGVQVSKRQSKKRKRQHKTKRKS